MQNKRQEIYEAINAADNALSHLHAAKNCLGSAGNWGVVDMIGGGFFSTLMKRSKMSNAEQELESARSALQHFAKELKDVNSILNINIRVGDFLSFADYFFDGIIADWMVQKKINEAKSQVMEAIGKVNQIRSQLQNLL
ncbi:MAG: hypothetical protein GX096_02510 [Clostridiales bacterium]|nr:hypothetical protein [Clostridiales bacterium]